MSGVIGALESAVTYTPLVRLTNDEIESDLLRFCSFCSIIHNKKLNNVTVFTLIVKNKGYRKIFMRLLQVDSEREAMLLFLKYNPTLCSSKVVREVLRS